MKSKFLLVPLVLAFLALSLGANAAKKWEKIGERSVSSSSDYDVIYAINKGRFRYLQLKVEDNAILFDKMVVNFALGGQQVVPLRNRIPAGGKSRIIDLKGDLKTINSIKFWYKSANKHQKAKIIIYGKK